MKKTKAKVS